MKVGPGQKNYIDSYIDIASRLRSTIWYELNSEHVGVWGHPVTFEKNI